MWWQDKKSHRETSSVTIATDWFFHAICMCVSCYRGRELLSAQITSPTCPARTTRATRLSLSTRWTASSVNQPSSRLTGGASGWPFPPSPSASQTLSSVCLLNVSRRLSDHLLVMLALIFISVFISRSDSRHRPGWREGCTRSFSWKLKGCSRHQLLLQVQYERTETDCVCVWMLFVVF